MKIYLSILYLLAFVLTTTNAQTKIIPGAERVDVYAPMLKGKSVAVFANQTSMVGNTHLVDTLVKRGIKVVKIFSPEHGFRGIADAGEKIGDYTDEKTGIRVISLYGTKRRPSDDDLKDVDIMIFDIQDVGVRFYTYISSLQEYMEAAFENSKPLLVLDRPNPNGFYVDGPVLDPKFKSFVGMQQVPIVYGLTIGEYAMMISGEKWLTEKANKKQEYYTHAQNSKDTPFHFLVIKCKNYDHKSKYILPIKPSPNLPDIQSIYLYPFTCLFEGTALSEGRGTGKPFQMFGHPSLPKNLISFTPRSTEGAKQPKLKDQVCYGWNLSGTTEQVLQKAGNKVQLKWLIQAYRLFPGKEQFFRESFNRLAGNDVLMQQIKSGKSESEIRKSWEPALGNYKKIRKKYLMYTDFGPNT
ncbi:MAG TPA: DUF1343 domain-containing protein [Chitinophagaceae bacterium]|nr:DUF1343 domain-containing protein [Chitinophagaceae bacterium]